MHVSVLRLVDSNYCMLLQVPESRIYQGSQLGNPLDLGESYSYFDRSLKRSTEGRSDLQMVLAVL